ncbi:MAG TPA: sigma-70 family RNA polymerase sigma factor [Opitutaceae bacterium]|nr:sigma-70 family RNA polymerase sigma factor [Opitutaceae bacterium]
MSTARPIIAARRVASVSPDGSIGSLTTSVPDSESLPPPGSSPAFATTRWTMVLRASGSDESARQALTDLCRAYWLPLYVYARRRGSSHHDAQDQTQGFLADMLERGALKRADPNRGAFRNFLLSSLRNYLNNVWDHDRAARRGGAVEHVPTSSREADGVIDQIVAEGLTPDRAFDRGWALAVFDRALSRLREEQNKLGRTQWFDRLKPLLQTGPKSGDYEAVAGEFGVSKNVVAVSMHRLSGRYRQLVRDEIAETVDGPEALEAELRELLASLSS